MSHVRAVPAVLALLALGAAPSGAQTTPGDNGLPPTNAAQCKAKVRGVDAALKWENDRWAKLSGRKLALRAKLTKKADAIKAEQATLKPQIDALKPQVDAAEAAAAADPSLQDQALALENQLFPLQQASADNKQKLQGIAYQIGDIDTEMVKLKKLHQSNVRNTIKYRKQVVNYCKRF